MRGPRLVRRGGGPSRLVAVRGAVRLGRTLGSSGSRAWCRRVRRLRRRSGSHGRMHFGSLGSGSGMSRGCRRDFQSRYGRTLLGGGGGWSRRMRRRFMRRRDRGVFGGGCQSGRRGRRWLGRSLRRRGVGRRRDGRGRLGRGGWRSRSRGRFGRTRPSLIEIHDHAGGRRHDLARRGGRRGGGLGWSLAGSSFHQFEDLVALLWLDRAELVADIKAVFLAQCQEILALHVQLSSESKDAHSLFLLQA